MVSAPLVPILTAYSHHVESLPEKGPLSRPGSKSLLLIILLLAKRVSHPE